MQSIINVYYLLLFVLGIFAKSFATNTVYTDNFSFNRIVNETNHIFNSKDPVWWLSSGGNFLIQDGIGKTIQGNLNQNEFWAKLYSLNNPAETLNGQEPQNIFRLVDKQKYENYSQEIYFKINKYNLVNNENRNAANGVFLLNRYSDENNLYYTGIRVDGNVVIKRKENGKYTTLAIKKVFPGDYDRQSEPVLIPEYRWIGLKSELNSDGNNTRIKLYLDTDGGWKQVLDVRDGNLHLTSPGNTGIRSDFMDLLLKNYRIVEDE